MAYRIDAPGHSCRKTNEMSIYNIYLKVVYSQGASGLGMNLDQALRCSTRWLSVITLVESMTPTHHKFPSPFSLLTPSASPCFSLLLFPWWLPVIPPAFLQILYLPVSRPNQQWTHNDSQSSALFTTYKLQTLALNLPTNDWLQQSVNHSVATDALTFCMATKRRCQRNWWH